MIAVLALCWAAAASEPLVPRDSVLENGLVLRVIEDHELPVASVLLMLPGGAVCDPAERLGTASLVARLLPEGSAERSAVELAEALEALGAELSVEPGAAFTTVSASFLARDLSAGLDLLAQIATRPRFDPAALERARSRALLALDLELGQASQLATRAVYRALYGEHPFGRPEGGTATGLQAVTAGDLRAFHEAHYRPAGSVLCVVGDVRPREARRLAEQAFGAWSGCAAPPTLPALPAAWRGTRKLLVDLPGQSQVQLRIARRTVARSHPEHQALRLGEALLGGGFSSRLVQAIRVERGLSYEASASLWSFDEDAVFQARTFARNDRAREALDLLAEQVEGWRLGGWSEEEFTRARAHALGMVPQVLETREARAWTLAVMDYQGLPPDHMARLGARIAAIGREEAETAVRTRLDGDGWLILLVGDLDLVGLLVEDFQGGGWERFEPR